MNAAHNETPQEAASRLATDAMRAGFKPMDLHCYQNADGSPAFYRIRCKRHDGEKWIRPMYRKGERFVLGMPPPPPEGRALYKPRFPLIESDPVLIVEGEQKADKLAALGITAVTSGGASSAVGFDWAPLRGRSCLIWPDKDPAGGRYAQVVANILCMLQCNVEVIDVSAVGLPDKGDCVDWLEQNPTATAADILGLPTLEPNELVDAEAADDSAEKVATIEAERHSVRNGRRPVVVCDVRDLLNQTWPDRETLLVPWLQSQALAMIYAWRGIGKTHVAIGIAYAMASAGNFLGWKAPQPVSVVYLDGEMPGPALRDRVARIVVNSENEPKPGFLRFVTPDMQLDGIMPNLFEQEGQAAIEKILGDAKVIIVDNLSCLVRGGKENEGESWQPVAEWALRMRARGRTVIFVHHSGKGGQQRGTSKREDLLDVVINLRRPADYSAEQGARFEVHFEKARTLYGQEVQPFEAALQTTSEGRQTWSTRTVESSTSAQMIELASLGMRDSEIAQELGCNRSTVFRALRKAEESGKYIPKAKRSKKSKPRAWQEPSDG